MKDQKLETCVHCLRHVESTELDHVFPDSWYPDSTPSRVQRWTVPSCSQCNRTLGHLEKELLLRIIGCFDPKSEAVSGLHTRALRSLGIDANPLSGDETAIRQKLRSQIRSEFVKDDTLINRSGNIIPGLGPSNGTDVEWVIPIPYATLSIIAEKIARGCEYKYRNRKRLVTAPYGILTAIRETDVIPEPFASACTFLDFGPGCKVRRLPFIEDVLTVWYFITIWGALHFHVRVELETELTKANEQYRKPEGVSPEEGKKMRIPAYLRTLDFPGH